MEKTKNELSKITLEERIEECIENVNKCFETSINIRKEEYPILMKEFDYLLENYKTSKQYKTILHEITNLQKEINKNFNNEERRIIEKLQDLLDTLYTEQAEEAFIAGYCLKIEMEKEKKI